MDLVIKGVLVGVFGTCAMDLLNHLFSRLARLCACCSLVGQSLWLEENTSGGNTTHATGDSLQTGA
jgi:hypothetical protein